MMTENIATVIKMLELLPSSAQCCIDLVYLLLYANLFSLRYINVSLGLGVRRDVSCYVCTELKSFLRENGIFRPYQLNESIRV